MAQKTQRIALFLDFDNLIIGASGKLEIKQIMDELYAMGSVIIRRAYGDWHQNERYRRLLAENGFTLLEQSNLGYGGKNGADIQLAIEAVEIAIHNPEITIFAIGSGDIDFLPLIRKLREYGRYVLIFSQRRAASDLIVKNCDQFIATETLGGKTVMERDIKEAVALMEQTIQSMEDRGVETLLANLGNQMRRIDPSFDPKLYGFSRLKEFVDFLSEHGYIRDRLVKNDKGAWHLISPMAPASYEPRVPRTSKWENRPLSVEEWGLLFSAIEKCIADGEGKPLQGKEYLVMAYFHSHRKKGVKLQVTNEVLHGALGELVQSKVLNIREHDFYQLADDYEARKGQFLEQRRESA